MIVPSRALALTALLALAACSGEAAPPDGEGTASVPAIDMPTAAASTPAIALPDPSDPNTLTPTGLGVVRVGTPPPQNGPSAWTKDDVTLSDTCQTWHANAYPDAYLMTDGSAVRRVTVAQSSPVRTGKGIGVGDSEAQVMKAYPDAVASPHKYVAAPAKYLDAIPADGEAGLRFEIDQDGKVSMIHAGIMPWLGYVEGCA